MIVVVYQDVHRHHKFETKNFLTLVEAKTWLSRSGEDICPAGETVDYVILDGALVFTGNIDNT